MGNLVSEAHLETIILIFCKNLFSETLASCYDTLPFNIIVTEFLGCYL